MDNPIIVMFADFGNGIVWENGKLWKKYIDIEANKGSVEEVTDSFFTEPVFRLSYKGDRTLIRVSTRLGLTANKKLNVLIKDDKVDEPYIMTEMDPIDIVDIFYRHIQ
jgi:hypothetical protein